MQERHNSIANTLELRISCTGFVQDRHNSIANALELHSSCTNQLVWPIEPIHSCSFMIIVFLGAGWFDTYLSESGHSNCWNHMITQNNMGKNISHKYTKKLQYNHNKTKHNIGMCIFLVIFQDMLQKMLLKMQKLWPQGPVSIIGCISRNTDSHYNDKIPGTCFNKTLYFRILSFP